jgi:hypothetical protein
MRSSAIKCFQYWGSAWLVVLLGGGGAVCRATEISQYGGVKAVWPTTWTALNNLNDPRDSGGRLDFVGDVTNPGAYVAMDQDYVYFRMRMDVGTVDSNTYGDALFVFIDNTPLASNPTPDYAFAWDSNGNAEDHGLEMKVPRPGGPFWKTTRMDDLDEENWSKGPEDINGLISGNTYRTGEGYVRSVDGQATDNFGTTSFLDFAVSWGYLRTHTTLDTEQSWNVAFGSVANDTDHSFIRKDVAGGAGPDDRVHSGWSGWINTGGGPSGGPEPEEVPEPSSLVVLSAVALSSYVARRFRRRQNAVDEPAAV